MLADTQLFFIWIIFTASLFWLLPSSTPKLRQTWLTAMSFIFIFITAPFAAMLVLWITIIASLSNIVFEKKHSVLLLWALILLAIAPLLSHRTVYTDATLITSLGVTFATLRALSIIIDSYAETAKNNILTNFTYMLFLPLYTVGPVDKASKFSIKEFSYEINLKHLFRGIGRTSIGLFKSTVIAEQLISGYIKTSFPVSQRDFSTFSSLDALTFIFLSFIYTYINFSAFVDIAVGTSKMFGFKIIENFKFPIFATSLQDFWKRWHISLGNWITSYLYMPIVFMIGKRWAPYLATFLAFSLIGWWHDSSINYILWGVFHGIGLCINQYWIKRKKKREIKVESRNTFFTITSWATTIFFVAWVQTIANQKTIEQAIEITYALFRL